MGTVKYTGPVASFHCPTNAEIRSLKVHFSPKQLGSGDPSPENVREIVGWEGITVQQTGKNLAVPVTPYLLPDIWADNSKVTKTGKGKIYSVYIPCKPNTTYTCSKSVESVVFVVCYTKEFPQIGVPIYGRIQHNNQDLTITTGSDAKYLFLWFYNNVYGDEIHTYEEVLNTIQIEESASVTHYESYRGRTTDYEFGVLGKNKLNAYAEQQPPSDTTSAPTTKRTFISDSYCVGMSWSNYYFPVNVTSYSVSNGTVTVSNVNVYGVGFPVKVFAGQTYYLSATTTSNGRAHVAYFTSDGTYISGVQTDIMNKSFVVPSNVSIAVIVLYSSGGEATFSNVQLELGSIATTYEPYDPNKTVYGGWVDLISGEVCEEYYKMIVDKDTPVGIMPWLGINTDPTTGEEFTAVLWKRSAGVPRAAGYSRMKCYCDTYPYHSLGSSTRIINTAGMYDGDAYGPSLLLPTSLIGTTTETLAAFMQDKTFTFVYQRSVPAYYSLSPTQLQTFLGHNNVWSNADYVEVEYDLHETQDILARKNFIIANQPHIETASGNIATFNTDMSAPLKECKIHFSPVQEGSGDPSPSNVRAISGWDAIDVQHQWYELPSEYQAIEYLQTDGKKYVKTGVVPFTGIGFKCKFWTNSYFGGGSYGCIFGGRYNSAIADFQITTYVGAQNGSFRNGTGVTSSAGLQRYVTQTISYINGLYTNSFGETYQYAEYDWDNDDRSREIYIFGLNNNSVFTQSGSGCRVYYLTIYKDDYVYRNFVPCYNKSTLEHGMFETVTQTFHGMQNTSGSEILGDDISGTTTSIALPSTFYGGYVDLINGELVEEWHQWIEDGSRAPMFFPWHTVEESDQYIDAIFSAFTENYYHEGSTDTTFCDCRKRISIHSSQFKTGLNFAEYNGVNYCSFAYCFPREDVENMTKQDLQNYLTLHPITIVYKLRTPIIHQLSPQILRTLRGQNNIWSTANGPVELSYWKH